MLKKRRDKMVKCSYCGAEVDEEAQFCSKCGANMTEEKPVTPRPPPRRRQSDRREACFGPPGSGTGLWGAISGGIFLIGLVVLWYYDLWWPGILILIALMAISGGIVAYTRHS